MTSIFGWDYPPGCSGTPFDEESPDNSIMRDAFPEYDGPSAMYRAAYKYTDCGPSVGFQINYLRNPTDAEIADGCLDLINEPRWVYCDSLHSLGTWEDMDKRGELVTAISVSSIVEGVDAEVPAEIIDVQWGGDPEKLSQAFDAALESVNTQADEIWRETHGCETCAKHFGINTDLDYSPIWENCPDCGGYGEVI